MSERAVTTRPVPDRTPATDVRPARSGEPVTRRRALFGLLDSNGWTWASIKALIWFLVIIMLLGYVPDRAYYFTVFSTIDLGINAVSPINICPPSNGDMPCPVPAGAVLPWQPGTSSQLQLPAPRANAAAVQSGESLLVIGGTDGQKAQSSVFATTVTADGNLTGWQNSKPLPAPRSHAAAAYLSGKVYLVGGLDENNAPTDTVFVGTPDQQSGAVTDWKADDKLKLPAARSDVALVATSDGLLAIGGSDGKAPASTVWRASVDQQGNLGSWSDNGKIGDGAATYARESAAAILVGKDLYLIGGTDQRGPTAQVLHAGVGADASGHQGVVSPWMVPTNASANLPAPRTNAASFAANGSLYVVGGSADGRTPASELYWATPDATGAIPHWDSMSQTNLPSQGLMGAVALPASSHAFLFGGIPGGSGTPGASVERSDLAAKPPIFALGLVGATIPALGIQKEIGQQLGYLAAAGVGTVNFIILILIGVAMAHPERTREIFSRLRRRRAA